MATLTTNKNFLSPVGFQFTIDRQKFPNIEYFCTAVSLPSISLASVEVPYKGVALTEPGNRLEFGELTLAFNVTENLENYIETFNWMHDIASAKGEDVENLKEDATLLVFTSHNNVNKTIRFKDIFPTAIGSLEFTSTAQEVNYLSTDINFSYTNFEFE